MGSSAKKKKDKKRDFQVCPIMIEALSKSIPIFGASLTISAEAQASGWEDKAEG
jgi:hypothetical protein